MYSSGSFLELLSTFSGWRLYDHLWQLLVDTGLAYLPFAALIFSGLQNAATQSSSGASGLQALRLSEMRLYIAFVIVLFAAAPIVPINPERMVYAEQSCTLSGGELRRGMSEHRPGATGTRYDQVRLDGGGASAPFWWWLLNSVGQGLTAAAINAIPCNVDLRQLSVDITASAVREPRLRSELEQFHRECWIPAQRRFLRHRAEQQSPPSGLSLEEDLAWAGSSLLLTTPGMYDSLYPQNAVAAFPYEKQRDEAFALPGYSTGGWPACDDWWGDAERGLRGRLLALMDEGMIGRWHHRFARSHIAEDQLLRAVLRADRDMQFAVHTSFAASGATGLLQESVMSALAGYGAWRSLPEAMVMFKLLRDSAPIMQALLQLLLIVSLPLLLAVSAYRLEVMLRLSFVFLSLIFWGFWFKLVYWVDNTLTEALLGEGWFTRTASAPFRILLQVVLFGMYILFPLLFTRFMGEAGHGVGVGIAHALSGGSALSATSSMQRLRLPHRSRRRRRRRE